MSNTLMEAARIDDPIEHTMGWLGGLIGAVAGLVVGLLVVAALVFFAPAAAAVIGALGLISIVFTGVSFGKSLGERFLKKKFEADKRVEGDIGQGSPNTTVGSRSLNAARVTDRVKCHRGKVIATGVKKININRLPASRKDEKTQCQGKILKGCATVKYGGESSEFPELVKMDADESPPTWLFVAYEIFDVANLVVSVLSLKAAFSPSNWANLTRGLRAWKIFDTAHSTVDLGFSASQKYFEGTWAEWYGRATDNYRFSAAQQGYAFTQTPGYAEFKFWWGAAGAAKSVAGMRMAQVEANHRASLTAPPAAPSSSPEVPPPLRLQEGAPNAAPPPATMRTEAPGAPAPPPATTRVSDPPGWADTMAAINAERQGRVELPEWHERMMGSRGD